MIGSNFNSTNISLGSNYKGIEIRQSWMKYMKAYILEKNNKKVTSKQLEMSYVLWS